MCSLFIEQIVNNKYLLPFFNWYNCLVSLRRLVIIKAEVLVLNTTSLHTMILSMSFWLFFVMYKSSLVWRFLYKPAALEVLRDTTDEKEVSSKCIFNPGHAFFLIAFFPIVTYYHLNKNTIQPLRCIE